MYIKFSAEKTALSVLYQPFLLGHITNGGKRGQIAFCFFIAFHVMDINLSQEMVILLFNFLDLKVIPQSCICLALYFLVNCHIS